MPKLISKWLAYFIDIWMKIVVRYPALALGKTCLEPNFISIMQPSKTVYMNLKMVWGLYMSVISVWLCWLFLSGHLWGCVSLGMVQAIWSLDTISELLMNTERMGSCWIVLLRFRSSPFLYALTSVEQVMGVNWGVQVKESGGVYRQTSVNSTDPSQRATLACGLAAWRHHWRWPATQYMISFHSYIKTSIKH